MLKNYFLIAIRNFWRHKTFSIFNILGLSIGISSALVIFLIASYDFGFDKFQKDHDRIYRVVCDLNMAGTDIHTRGVPFPLSATIGKEITGIGLVAGFVNADEITKVSVPTSDTVQPATFRNQYDIAYADTAYTTLLNYTWLAGSPLTALSQPYQVVLTENNAKQYFPRLTYDQIIGKHLIFADTITTTVTGIIKDLPKQTDFNCKTLISYATLTTKRMQPMGFGDWSGETSASQVFIKLDPGITPEHLAPQLRKFYDKYNKPQPGSHDTGAFSLEPLADIHFSIVYGISDQRPGPVSKNTLYGLMAIAAFLLLLACINFINLTTAQASQRAKEIGIRKTMGSQRIQLALQFLNETFLLTTMATILSVILAPLLLKAFANFIPKDLTFNLGQPQVIIFLTILIVTVSLLSGAYPALVLSSFKPVSVLKNQLTTASTKTRGVWMRKTLTVSQFVIAQVFIIATILVAKQINYALNVELGFKKDAILNLYTPYNRPPSQRDVLLQKMKSIPDLTLISRSSAPPSSGGSNRTDTKYNDGKKEIRTTLQCRYVDTNYLRLYHLNLLAGSNITQSDTTNQLLINETYAHMLGFTDPRKAIGIRINFNDRMLPVVGIIADFHQASLHNAIEPTGILNGISNANNFDIALPQQNAEGTRWKSIIAQLESAYKSVYPEDDFSPQFFDESIAQFYTQEKNTSTLLLWATGLAIFISCLGLLGLVIYITNQRTKEIGIRKVIGASVTQIVFLLSKDFLKLIGLAILIAMPIAWWGSHKWLQDFAYQTPLSWWIFAGGAAALLIIALAVLTIRAVKAANANPVNSLKTE